MSNKRNTFYPLEFKLPISRYVQERRNSVFWELSHLIFAYEYDSFLDQTTSLSTVANIQTYTAKQLQKNIIKSPD